MIEFESKDLSLVFIKFKLIGFLPWFQFTSSGVTRPSDCGFDTGGVGVWGCDVIRVDVSVEAMKEEGWDLDEGEDESEEERKCCVDYEVIVARCEE